MKTCEEHDYGVWHVVTVVGNTIELVGQCLRGNCQATIEGSVPLHEARLPEEAPDED